MNYSEKHFEEQEEIRLENTQAQLAPAYAGPGGENRHRLFPRRRRIIPLKALTERSTGSQTPSPPPGSKRASAQSSEWASSPCDQEGQCRMTNIHVQ